MLRRLGLVPTLAVALLATVGCSPSVHATAMRLGPVYPAKPVGCPVRFENIAYGEGDGRLEALGTVTLSGTSNPSPLWEGETRDRLWPKVCEIGGDTVSPIAAVGGVTVMGMGTGMIQFAVWRSRQASL